MAITLRLPPPMAAVTTTLHELISSSNTPPEEEEDQHDFVHVSPAFLHPVSAWAVTSNSTAPVGTATSSLAPPHDAATSTVPQNRNDHVDDVLPRAIATNIKPPLHSSRLVQFPSSKQQPNISSGDAASTDDYDNVVVVEAITLPAYAEQTQPYSVAVDAPTIISSHHRERDEDASAAPPISERGGAFTMRRRRRRTRQRIPNRRGRPDSEQWGRNDGDGHDGAIASADAIAIIATPVLILHPKVEAFKRRRKRRTVAASVIGGVVGGVLLAPLGAGPAGVVLGALTAGAAAKAVGKHRQGRLARRLLLREETTRS